MTTLSAEAAVLHAAIEKDYAEVNRLLEDQETWSLDGIWAFQRQCEELTSHLWSTYHRLQKERDGG